MLAEVMLIPEVVMLIPVEAALYLIAMTLPITAIIMA
jgi:hypothetical protein